jgi:hypothetical protein
LWGPPCKRDLHARIDDDFDEMASFVMVFMVFVFGVVLNFGSPVSCVVGE